MTQEEKELLLKDLCARLPYGVKCLVHYTFNNETTYGEDVDTLFADTIAKIDIPNNMVYVEWNGFWVDIDDCKPYLRPMSSMTEEERKEYKHLVAFSGSPGGAANFIDWLNKKMFDYRTDDEDEGKTMIEKGFALEAPKGMYKK